MKYQIDDTDRKILSYLVKNARMPFLEIARECGISGAAIHQRVRKMEECGIIEGSRYWRHPRPCPHVQNGCQRNRKHTGGGGMSFHHRKLYLSYKITV